MATIPPRRGEEIIFGGKASIRFSKYLEDLAGNQNSSSGSLTAILARLDIIESRLDLVEARVTYLEGAFVVTAVNVTSIGNQTIVCTAEVTVSLTVSPNDKDIVRVKQTSEEVTVDGNGRNIDGNSEIVLRKQNNKIKTGLDFIYSSELDEWFLI